MSDDNLPTLQNGGDVTIYDPDLGLKNIAVADAVVAHLKRAWQNSNDPFLRQQLEEVIDRKIDEQIAYIAWRDGVVVPSREIGKQSKSDGISDLKSHKDQLPAADPGDVVVHRWRKRFLPSAASPTLERSRTPSATRRIAASAFANKKRTARCAA
jgi:hypothetical protein